MSLWQVWLLELQKRPQLEDEPCERDRRLKDALIASLLAKDETLARESGSAPSPPDGRPREAARLGAERLGWFELRPGRRPDVWMSERRAQIATEQYSNQYLGTDTVHSRPPEFVVST